MPRRWRAEGSCRAFADSHGATRPSVSRPAPRPRWPSGTSRVSYMAQGPWPESAACWVEMKRRGETLQSEWMKRLRLILWGCVLVWFFKLKSQSGKFGMLSQSQGKRL